MPIVTERDKDIFRFLSSGPATILQIKSALDRINRNKEGTTGTRKAMLYIRISKLIRGGYLKRQYYPNMNGSGKFALYALTDMSAQVLVEQGYPIESIRQNLPSRFNVSHDLQVTDIVRAIKREAYKSHYEVKIIDELSQKSKKVPKEMRVKAYPDLLISLKLKDSQMQLAIEVDNSTITVREMLEKLVNIAMPYRNKKIENKTLEEKLRSISRPVINVCTRTSRIEELRKGFALQYSPQNLTLFNKDGVEFDQLNKHIYFVLLDEICNRGLLGSKFTRITGDKAEITAQGIFPTTL